MNPSQLADEVLAAAATVLTGLGRDPSVLPPATIVERPRHPGHGDYASALSIAGLAVSRSAIPCASSRGGRPARFATCSASADA